MAAVSQRLPTLLLGTVAGWALLVYIVVQTGLGARYGLHPDDASRVPELPRLDLSRAQTPIGELATYAQVGERPLFNADRKPLPPPVAPDAGKPETPEVVALDVTLTSVILSGGTRIAIVLDKKSNKSQAVKVGDSLVGDQSAWKLVELAPRKAVFEGPTGRVDADLRVFDGSGGEAPTAVVSESPPQEGVAGVNPQAAAAAANSAAANPGATAQPQTPEARAELIRRRIEERRRQMREEAERANKQGGGP